MPPDLNAEAESPLTPKDVWDQCYDLIWKVVGIVIAVVSFFGFVAVIGGGWWMSVQNGRFENIETNQAKFLSEQELTNQKLEVLTLSQATYAEKQTKVKELEDRIARFNEEARQTRDMLHRLELEFAKQRNP